jgi:putative transposase
LVYHVLNRAVARLPLFEKTADYEAFERVLAETQQRHPTRILAYCLMPNHWHFVLWPRADDELTAFLRWLTHTHTMRWHAHHQTAGTGHLYQGRFKSFPIQTDEHLYTVLRYVERNAVRAKLVSRAEQWRWSSVGRRATGDGESLKLLSSWPVEMPSDWLRRLNRPQTEAELEAVRTAVRRGCPYGGSRWQKNSAVRLGLQYSLRPRGRPSKTAGKKELRPLL